MLAIFDNGILVIEENTTTIFSQWISESSNSIDSWIGIALRARCENIYSRRQITSLIRNYSLSITTDSKAKRLVS